jgi:hypothetical protein
MQVWIRMHKGDPHGEGYYAIDELFYEDTENCAFIPEEAYPVPEPRKN